MISHDKDSPKSEFVNHSPRVGEIGKSLRVSNQKIQLFV